MPLDIQGLHHVTAISGDARTCDAFWRKTMGLRRVKKTVNFDAPDVYHLYYGDGAGTPGTVMTYFPFSGAQRGRPGRGETASTVFAVPQGAASHWAERLGASVSDDPFGAAQVLSRAPDGTAIALVEASDPRTPYTAHVPAEHAIRGFHSVVLKVADATPMADLLGLMGYAYDETRGRHARFKVGDGPAGIVDLIEDAEVPPATQGAGSVHHVAFRVPSREAQDAVRDALTDAGFDVTPPIDRDYFHAIYFRTPGGILFEVATDPPGFDRDEPQEALGRELKLPDQHEHRRAELERTLMPLDD